MKIKKLIFILLTGNLCLTFSWSQNRQNEVFDASRIKDIQPNWRQITHSFLSTPMGVVDSSSIDTTKQELDGYRLQVFATRYSQSADSLKTILESQTDKKIYIVFDAPVYKVRIGNFVSRNEAEIFQNEIKKRGYTSAWIVRSKVFSRNFQLFERRKH